VSTAAERGSGDFGSTLKAAREKRGVSLRHISTITKISVAALEALERNDISRLPGGIFSRAFVRSYALEVGLDPDVTIEKFVAQFPEAAVPAGQAAAEQQEEEQAHDSNQQTAATFARLIAISVAVVAALLYFGTMSRRGSDTPSPATAVGKDTSAAAPAPERGTATVPSGAAAPPATAGAPARAPESSDRVTVAVVATGPSWVSAIVDGERVVARDFRTGERISFDVGRSVVLTAGDAAALAVTINGEEARPLGSSGQVVTVRVTPANFKEYLAAP
jgi:cytoskeleton protein RodZ